ncbi:MAG: DUF4834 family protein [Bacteroidales bacterium]|nr:DUF4834 family protein [Bacteroidales bacterium]MCF8402915.1 DUF4834 family protein [Bacteroidales bacterium]
MRYIMPLIARYFIRKTITNFEKQGKPAQKKEGEITIETAPKKKSQTDSLGEYVDYEEVDE